MSFQRNIGVKTRKIGNNKYIILERKTEEGYVWDNVTFKTDKDSIYLGAYYVYDYSVHREWLEYNSNTIALLSKIHGESEIKVISLFDVKSKLFFEGSNNDLVDYYRQQFNHTNSSEKVEFQRKLLLKKVEN